MSYCSPNVNIKDHYTCFEYDELKEIALAFNIYIQTNKVCPNTKRTKNTNNKKCLPTSLININKSFVFNFFFCLLSKRRLKFMMQMK